MQRTPSPSSHPSCSQNTSHQRSTGNRGKAREWSTPVEFNEIMQESLQQFLEANCTQEEGITMNRFKDFCKKFNSKNNRSNAGGR